MAVLDAEEFRARLRERRRGLRTVVEDIRDELIRLGVPASQIAFMQDYKRTEAKQRLFGDVRAGKVRFLIGSSETIGTGVKVQLRLKALHHLDVPWLPSQIEQREGRIVRQGNQMRRSKSSPVRQKVRSTHPCGRTRTQSPVHRCGVVRRHINSSA
jgi:hypothetical protein